ncbi:RNA 2',3'-cyclic phosphodiesterase [Defluviitalea saccharophila]|uniref:RNA 2',3'-cyclic phosphodiesterase n=1 Tax=Defluviitalea saccharophila TaxID=879970 RepID=A0ABZ2Y7X4_9FIRM|nr:RNA 2',3'-cyclic phosphodiesterase [Candidatus Epulonipiscium sp.]
MRIFIAITFNEAIKSYLQEVQNEIRSFCYKGNFSLKENFHLTLRFIGEVNPSEIINIQKAMDQGAESSKGFKLELSQLGSFERQNEHLIWIGLKGEVSELNQLYNTVQSELFKIGIPRENKPLKPHITLARRVQIKDSFDDLRKKMIIDHKLIQVDSIVLMESRRINGILTYIPIYEKRLCDKE